MKTIKICMGSACHLKGAPLVAQALQEELNKRQLGDQMACQLIGDFCQNQCLEGVIVKYDDQVLTKVTPADVPRIVQTILGELS